MMLCVIRRGQKNKERDAHISGGTNASAISRRPFGKLWQTPPVFGRRGLKTSVSLESRLTVRWRAVRASRNAIFYKVHLRGTSLIRQLLSLQTEGVEMSPLQNCFLNSKVFVYLLSESKETKKKRSDSSVTGERTCQKSSKRDPVPPPSPSGHSRFCSIKSLRPKKRKLIHSQYFCDIFFTSGVLVVFKKIFCSHHDEEL